MLHQSPQPALATGEPLQELSFRRGVIDCIPTLLGYLSIGFACGVVGKTAGLSVIEIALLSLFLYAGSAQFIVAGMIAAGSPAIPIIVTILFVNLRHLLMSAAMVPFFRQYSLWKNVGLGAQLTDETFGVAIGKLQENQKHADRWMLGLNMTAHANWIAANVAGAIMGAWIMDPQAFGLDYALPAMFVGLLVMQVGSRNPLRTDLIVAACSIGVFIGLAHYISGSIAMIVAAVLAAGLGVLIEHDNRD
ncbi:AzlC family ABC transporter permease [Paenibacillus nanensis]|uniref:AzlC family ABC transporter permease n=1 Tax=Paenibacillus nanensis TaxID=393251 RepID=UPI001F0BBD56|nr:AzlC family ABC transporter permease [Paenibacillus nanensis]